MVSEAITLKALAPLISKLSTTFAEPAKGAATKAKEKLEIKFRLGFSNYLAEQVKRFSYVKTIISASTPIPLLDLYVNLHLNNGKTSLRDDDFVSLHKRYMRVLFTATAGSGKSMLMRYLYLRILESQQERLPIFMDLRDLNQANGTSLKDFLRAKIREYIEGFSERQLHYALDTGKIILFLDGFDEIDHDKREKREAEINDLSARYTGLFIFLSSRPFETFAGWERFFVFAVQPFSKKQVELLIEKIPYDQERKDIFLSKLENGLYDTHKTFLANPLLTVMMLLTLEHTPDVPEKLHLFYEHAFHALFGRHDVTKGGFQRKKYTSLELDDFKRLFSYFCAASYMKEKLSFTSEEFTRIIDIAICSSQIITDKESFKNDLVESVCMLVPEGLEYSFSHRSFQEYFVAYFLSRVKIDEFDRFIPRIVSRAIFDGVLVMLYEMSKERFEEAYALPKLNELCRAIEGVDPDKDPIAYCEAILGKPEILISNDGFSVHIPRENPLLTIRMVLFRVYGVFNAAHRAIRGIDAKEKALVSSVMKGHKLEKDPRFLPLRQGNEHQKRVIIIPNNNDAEWFKQTSFGALMVAEAIILRRLRNDVEKRVNARTEGIEGLFLLK